MEMDLWWCPVCERAITENKEAPVDLVKRTSNSPSPPHYTGRGGLYGSQESLYCSEACRKVEELNGRFAFEQLAACLPVFCERTSLEEPESEGTQSGTDEFNTDRSRSLSLGRRSVSQRTSTSSSLDINLSNPDQLKGSNQPLVSKEPSLEVRSTAGRVPILLSPNGTPLVQPIFPQRPTLAPHQRRHFSQISPDKRFSLYTTAVARMAHPFKSSGRPAANPSNSVPTYPPSVIGQRGPADRARSILNNASTIRNDMEFGAEARREKPTYLWRHYDLFYRPRPGSRRGEWAECSSPTEAENDCIPALERNLGAMTRQVSQIRNYKRNSCTKQVETDGEESISENKRVVGAPAPDILRASRSPTAKDWNSTQGFEVSKLQFKNRKSLLAESKCSRSWSWDHLPSDVPQYPAMDLEQIRVSKLIREQKLSGLRQNSTDAIGSKLKALPISQSSVENSCSVTTIIPSSKIPIQTKKKLFVFQ